MSSGIWFHLICYMEYLISSSKIFLNLVLKYDNHSAMNLWTLIGILAKPFLTLAWSHSSLSWSSAYFSPLWRLCLHCILGWGDLELAELKLLDIDLFELALESTVCVCRISLHKLSLIHFYHLEAILFESGFLMLLKIVSLISFGCLPLFSLNLILSLDVLLLVVGKDTACLQPDGLGIFEAKHES